MTTADADRPTSGLARAESDSGAQHRLSTQSLTWHG